MYKVWYTPNQTINHLLVFKIIGKLIYNDNDH